MIDLNSYYSHKEYGLVRTVARAKDTKSKEDKILFCGVQAGGLAGDMLLEEEGLFLRNVKL